MWIKTVVEVMAGNSHGAIDEMNISRVTNNYVDARNSVRKTGADTEKL